MFDKLDEVEKRFEELAKQMADPSLIADQQEYRKVAKAYADLADLVHAYREYKKTKKELADIEEMLHEQLDPEMRDFAQQELNRLKSTIEEQEHTLKVLLLPKDPNDDKDVLVEIRAGTGGDEAALFAADLLRIYTRYAERRGWKVELLSSLETGIGGYKEAILEIKGKGAYSSLKYESGVHRVQRVPETESSGRIHTSAATVSVLPEADEIEVQINPDDLEIDTYRASSAGGQNVQKNETAIRITHKPTGTVVTCQDERSQLQNKERAMRMLRTILYENMQREQQNEIAEARRSHVGSGDRSEKIRTYNFPQGRVTDHRIGLTLYRLESILDGDIQEIIDALNTADQAAKLGEAMETNPNSQED